MTPSESNILKAYNLAKERYPESGVGTDKTLFQFEKISICLHCCRLPSPPIALFLGEGILGGLNEWLV